MNFKIIKINSKEADLNLLDEAVRYLHDGCVIAYPTETIYGLGADVFNDKAVKQIYKLKARDYGLPISVLISDIEMLSTVVQNIPDSAFPLIHKFWPGPLTLIFTARPTFSKQLITSTGKIGVRYSSHRVASELVRRFGKPITTTSANLSDYPPSLSVKHVLKYFGDKIPCVVDGGECTPSKGSTVVDITEDAMRIIREGDVPADELIECFQKGK